MNNQIFISNLVVPIIIGVPDWERAIPQNLFIDLNIILKKNDAFNSDNIEATIDYSSVIELIKSLATEKAEEFKKYEEIGIKTSVSTGDPESSEPWLANADIIVCTS
ncbi:MAG: dihydroneopterin aldolase, partial [Methylophilaceae bacterium]